MRPEIDSLSPWSLITGWLLAFQGIVLCLFAAVLGQGLGAWLGGCGWIGFTTPVDRQVWALVNQPNLAFAASGAAAGYWLGSVGLPVVLAAILLLCFPRPASVYLDMVCTHTAWAMALIGVAFVPLLDAVDGHLVRWLHFAELPPELRWLVPTAALPLAALAALRVLALSRRTRTHAGRASRLAVVWIHLVFPSLAWIGLAAVVARAVPVAAVASALLVIGPVSALVWFRYPQPPVYNLRPLDVGDVVRAAWVLCLLAAALWFGGHPLADGRRSGILWDVPSATNNLRDWVAPLGG